MSTDQLPISNEYADRKKGWDKCFAWLPTRVGWISISSTPRREENCFWMEHKGKYHWVWFKYYDRCGGILSNMRRPHERTVVETECGSREVKSMLDGGLLNWLPDTYPY